VKFGDTESNFKCCVPLVASDCIFTKVMRSLLVDREKTRKKKS